MDGVTRMRKWQRLSGLAIFLLSLSYLASLKSGISYKAQLILSLAELVCFFAALLCGGIAIVVLLIGAASLIWRNGNSPGPLSQILFPVLILGAIALISCVLILYPILENGPGWPSIENPSALVEDCNVISKSFETGEVPESKWPARVRELHPVKVFVTKNDNVEIMLSK